MTETDMRGLDRLCKNCKWCRPSFFQKLFNNFEYAKCGHISSLRERTDDKLKNYYYCQIMRCPSLWRMNFICGYQGRYFEEKEKLQSTK